MNSSENLMNNILEKFEMRYKEKEDRYSKKFNIS